jgi:hypothetical protein
MYDCIKFKCTNLTNAQCDALVRLFGLIEIKQADVVTQYQNRQNKNFLPQYGGVFVNIHIDEKGRRTMKVELSLHKYWNVKINGLHLHNYNRFTISDANKAAAHLSKTFADIGIQIEHCAVYACEIGLNLILAEPPENIMRQVINTGKKEVLQSRDYDKNKLYGTHCTKEFRFVDVFYDKVHEVKKKNRKSTNNDDMPNFILRCELKVQNKELSEKKTTFCGLFDTLFIDKLQKRFKDNFCNKIAFEPPQYKPPPPPFTPENDTTAFLADGYLTALIQSYYYLQTETHKADKHLQDCKEMARKQVQGYFKERKDKDRLKRKITALQVAIPSQRSETESKYKALFINEFVEVKQ